MNQRIQPQSTKSANRNQSELNNNISFKNNRQLPQISDEQDMFRPMTASVRSSSNNQKIHFSKPQSATVHMFRPNSSLNLASAQHNNKAAQKQFVFQDTRGQTNQNVSGGGGGAGQLGQSLLQNQSLYKSQDFSKQLEMQTPTITRNKVNFGKIEKAQSIKPLQYYSTYMLKQDISNVVVSQQGFLQFFQSSNPYTSNYGQGLMQMIKEHFLQWHLKLQKQTLKLRQELLQKAKVFENNEFVQIAMDLAPVLEYSSILKKNAEIAIDKYPKYDIQQIYEKAQRQYSDVLSIRLCIDLQKNIREQVEDILLNEKNLNSVSIHNIIKRAVLYTSYDISDNELFKEFIENFKDYLRDYEQDSETIQRAYASFSRYNEKVGHLSTVNLMDPNTYDIEEAAETFAELLPKSQEIKENLLQVGGIRLASRNVKSKAKRQSLKVDELKQKLEEKLSRGPEIILEVIEDRVSKSVYVNIPNMRFYENFPAFMQNNRQFLINVCKSQNGDNDKFINYLPSMEKKIQALHEIYKNRINSFAIAYQEDKAIEGVFFVDEDNTKIITELKESCQVYDKEYQALWDLLGQIRTDLKYQKDLFADDRSKIQMEIQYMDQLLQVRTEIKEVMEQLSIFTAPVPSLLEDGIATSKEVLQKSKEKLQELVVKFNKNFKESNQLSYIFVRIDIKDPLIRSFLLKDRLPTSLLELHDQVLSNPTLEQISAKVNIYERIRAIFADFKKQQHQKEANGGSGSGGGGAGVDGNSSVKGSGSGNGGGSQHTQKEQQQKAHLKSAFDHLLYIELKQFFDYSTLDKHIEYLNKKVDLVIDSNEFPDITGNQKKVENDFNRLQDIKKQLGNYKFEQFTAQMTRLDAIRQKYSEFDLIVGQKSEQIFPSAQYTLEILRNIYAYIFNLINPMRSSLLKCMTGFQEFLQNSFTTIEGIQKNDNKEFPRFNAMVTQFLNLLQVMSNFCNSVVAQLRTWTVLPTSVLEEAINIFASYMEKKKFCFVLVQNIQGKSLYLDGCSPDETPFEIKLRILQNPFFGEQSQSNQQQIMYNNIQLQHQPKSLQKFYTDATIGKLKLLFGLNSLDNVKIGKIGRYVYTLKEQQVQQKKMFIHVAFPFNRSIIEIIDSFQGDKVIEKMVLNRSDQELTQEVEMQLFFVTNQPLYTQLYVQIRETEDQQVPGITKEEGVSSEHKQPEPTIKQWAEEDNSEKPPKSKDLAESQQYEQENEEEEKKKGGDAAKQNTERESRKTSQQVREDAPGFVRLSYKKPILFSTVEDSTLDLTRISINFQQNEQWKLYCQYDPQMNLLFQIKIRDPYYETFLGDVDMQNKSWKDLVLREQANFGYEHWTVKQYMGSEEEKPMFKRMQYWITVDCAFSVEEIKILDLKVFLYGRAGEKECQSYTFTVKEIQGYNTLWVLGYIQDDEFVSINKFVKELA